MKIRRNQIRGLLSFLFHHNHRHLAQTLDCPDKSGDLKGFVFAIQEKGDLPVSRIEGGVERVVTLVFLPSIQRTDVDLS
jgi:hypothetical protein